MLEHFFGSKTRLKLLRVFFASPERAWFGRELARLLDTQLNAVRREIANLEEVGAIRQVEFSAVAASEGSLERAKYYKLDSIFFYMLKSEPSY